jgi:hypothetical protein
VEIFDSVILKKFVIFPDPAGPGGPCSPEPDPPFRVQIHEVTHIRQIIDCDSVEGLITGAADTGRHDRRNPKMRTRENIFFLMISPFFNEDADQECRENKSVTICLCPG